MVQVILVCSFCVVFVWIICESSYKNHSENLLREYKGLRKAIDVINKRINDLIKEIEKIKKGDK